MLKLNQLSLRRGTRLLLDDVNLHLKFNQKIGLVGKNGCGKSSLFALLQGELLPDHGTVEIPSGISFAHLEQEVQASDQKAIDYVLDGDKELREFQSALAEAENKNNGLKIADLHEKIRVIDGYAAHARAASLLDGLGFSQRELEQPVKSFSGGWRMRLNLARTLISRADIILLDEPTNHLDLPALLWLEAWLKKIRGTILLISHDRDFLDGVVTSIAHIEHQKIKLYSGNYSFFERQRIQTLALQQSLFEKQQKARAHMQDFVNRFKAKATKAKQAQSRVKALEKMSLLTAAHVDSAFDFQFKKPEQNPDPLLRLEKCDVGYSKDNLILKNIKLAIRPGDRLGVIGPNGAGKSTFIKLLSGELKQIKGRYESNAQLNIGYFAQHQLDQLVIDASPLEHVQMEDSKATEQICRNFLGGFGFKDDMATTPITHFSGGEKARLALALLVWRKPNLLLLDEPTNHFDLEMREALTISLQGFKGALLVISHDRHLIRASTDELILVHDQQIKKFEGSIDDYPAWLEEIRLKKKKLELDINSNSTSNYEADSIADTKTHLDPASQDSTNKLSKKQERQEAARKRDQQKPLLKKIKVLENDISTLEKKLKHLETQLAAPSLYEDENKDKLKTIVVEQAEIKKDLLEKEAAWLQLHDE